MKKIGALFILLSYLTVFHTEEPAAASVPLYAPVSAQSAILLDPRTNKILYSKRANYRRPGASTTKVITALVILDNVSLNRVVTVPRSAEYIPPSKIYLRRGERFYVRDLLKALLISSANDSAHTLAVAAAGSEARFAQMMTAKARRLGARNTRFTNASGLPHPNGQVTTAYDLAIIMKEAKKNPFIAQLMSQRTASIRALTGRRVFLKNHNKMLWRTGQAIQGKTGYTRRARHCFVGKIKTADRGDVLVAIMGSHRLWHDLAVLLRVSRRLSPKQAIKASKLSNKETAEIQRSLLEAGFYHGKVTGTLGPKTLNAVKRFQKSRGLAPDGIVGPKTRAALRAV